MVTLLKRSVSGFAGRLGATTARRCVKPSVLVDRACVNAAPAWPCFDPMIRSMWATSFPSPISDSPMKKSAGIPNLPIRMWSTSSTAGGHECGIRSGVARGCGISHAVPPLRVALSEPYRCGANLPAAPRSVKPAQRPPNGTFRGATPRRPPPPGATLRPRATRGAAARSPARPVSSPPTAGRCRARARSDRPALRAAAGSCAARAGRAGSCGLDAERAVVGPLELVRRRPQRGCDAVLGNVGLDESRAKVITGAFGEDLAAHEPRRRREAPREEPQPQPEAGLVEDGCRDAPEEGVELAGPAVLTPRVAEVLPRLEAGRRRLRRRHGRALVHEQLAQRRPTARVPVVVTAAEVRYQAPQLGAARRRGVADRVRDFVRDPERAQVWREPQ